MLNGKPFADAVQKAREAVNAKKSADWADYIQYGNVEFPLRFRFRHDARNILKPRF